MKRSNPGRDTKRSKKVKKDVRKQKDQDKTKKKIRQTPATSKPDKR